MPEANHLRWRVIGSVTNNTSNIQCCQYHPLIRILPDAQHATPSRCRFPTLPFLRTVLGDQGFVESFLSCTRRFHVAVLLDTQLPATKRRSPGSTGGRSDGLHWTVGLTRDNGHDENLEFGPWHRSCERPDSDTARRLKARFRNAESRKAAMTAAAPYRVNLIDWWISRLVRGAPSTPIIRRPTGALIPRPPERNRQRQRQLDRQRRATSPVKNNVALDLKHSTAEVWLVGPDAADLVKNNVAFFEVVVIQWVIPLSPASCKEHRSGSSDVLRV